MNINRNYKDSIFVKLFSDKKEIIKLYNAIKGTKYSVNKTDIDIITLENVLYMERNNDLCFTIDDKFVVLIEHQSSINDNMPLRFLLYIAREYEKLLDTDNIYKRKLIKVPTPEFIVLYNGESNYPENKKLYLSDAFKVKENAKLELVVEVININYDKNTNIINKCKKLKEYSYFIHLVREYIKKYKDKVKKEELIKISIEKAIKDCIEQNILKEFLKLNSSEVVNMLYTEFDIEKAQEIWTKEAFEDGLEQGIEKGIECGMIKQIKALKEFNISKDKIINKIIEDYNVSKEIVEKYLE